MKIDIPLKSKFFFVIFLLTSSISGMVLATPAEELELEQLDRIERDLELQRDWAKYRWGKAKTDCYQNYWVDYCLRSARAQYRKEVDPIASKSVSCMKCSENYAKVSKTKKIKVSIQEVRR